MELNKIICMDCLIGMKQMPDNSVDAVVTDPPYGLEFMGKEWDKLTRNCMNPQSEADQSWNENHPQSELARRMRDRPDLGATAKYAKEAQAWHYDWAKEVLRVLKPGGHLLSFGGSRTYHRMACAIEDAGFEIRDQIMWVYGSGFPKSLNIGKAINKIDGVKFDSKPAEGVGFMKPDSDDWHQTKNMLTQAGESSERAKQWEGWGTALKPAHEPIVLARKPLSEKSVAENVLKWGTGGINIDGCRVGTEKHIVRGGDENTQPFFHGGFNVVNKEVQGRFPSNLIHVGSDEVEAEFAKAGDCGGGKSEYFGVGEKDGSGSASRFFYCAKASKEERDMGCIGLEYQERTATNMNWRCEICNKFQLQGNGDICKCENPKWMKPIVHNNHPTVKPITLMEYLIKLITPPKGIVLDPFIGSGTTAIACKKLGMDFIGFEISPEYCKIAETRLKAVPVRLDKLLGNHPEVIKENNT